MQILHDIENMLCKELEDVKRKGEISSNSMEVISKSLDGIKDIYTIEAMKESGYSNAYEYSGMHTPWYSYDGMNGNSYRGYDGNAYDGRGRGRYADRDSQGRYSSEGYSRNSEEEIRRLMEKAGDPHEREILKRALDDMRNK